MSVARSAMMSVLVSMLVAVCALGAQANTVTGTLSSSTHVEANTEVTIEYGLTGPKLTIELDAASNVTLTASAMLSVSMPSGYESAGLGVSTTVGYELALSGSASIVSATLVTSQVIASVVTTLSGGASAACLRFDANANAYTQLATTTYSSLTKKMTVDLPVAGVYIFATVGANVPLPTLYAEARATSATSAKISYPGGFELEVSTASSNEVTVTRNTYSTNADPSGYSNAGVYFDVELDTEEPVDAVLRYHYTAYLDIDASAAADLKFAFYNTTAAAWQFPASGLSVDTNAGVVAQSTTHFSSWAVFRAGSDEDMSNTNQNIAPGSSKCYAVDYDTDFGIQALTFELTKVDGGGNLRMYAKRGSDCPTDSDHDKKSGLVTDDDESTTVCYSTADSGRYMISVYREGLAGAGSSTTFSLKSETGFFCSSALTAHAVVPALYLVAIVAALFGANSWM